MKREDLKILFVNPCIRRNAPTKQLPVGLGYVMTFLDRNGYSNFDLLDIDIDDLENDVVEAYVRDREYDVVLIGCIVTHYKWIKWFVRMVKRHHPETRVIVGNSVAGSITDVFLANVPADAAVVGEGEVTTLEALDALREGRDLRGVEGLALRNGMGIVKTPKRKAAPIDSYPFPDWDCFDERRYTEKSSLFMSVGVDEGGKEKQVVAMPVCTARGCTFRCTFCHFVFWDDVFRLRSPENVLGEIARNQERYGMNYASFWDDLSFATVAQVEKLCDAIIASGLKFNWMATIRCDLFGKDKQTLQRRTRCAEKMRAAGCLSVGTALESGNPEILAMMNKRIDPDDYIRTVEIMRNAGIVVNISVVFGYPIETRETIRQTFDMCLATKIYPSIGFLLPLPYTGMYQYAKDHGFIDDDDAYLDSITERQDICLNMTRLSDDQIMAEIKDGAKKLNDLLQLGLTEDRLIKTGGDKPRTNMKVQFGRDAKEFPLDPENIRRNEGDFSFNYSESIFQVDSGVRAGKDGPA